MRKAIVVFALVVAAFVTAAAASAGTTAPSTTYCLGGVTTTTSDEYLQSTFDQGVENGEVFLVTETPPDTADSDDGYYTYPLDDSDDTSTAVSIAAGACPVFVAGPSGNYFCTPADTTAPFVAPNWNTTVADLANGDRNPYAVPGNTVAGPNVGKFHLDCGTHTAVPGAFVDSSGETFSTPGLANQPGWYPEATS